MTRFSTAMLGLGIAILGAPLSAQWSADAALNLPVADAASDQRQPKVLPTADGGCWISWFDGLATGWDVRVSRLDVGGVETLGHGGVLVADRGFSSTQDYGLDVDGAGNAWLAYRDDGGVGVQIGANKVAPDGALLWGPTGVQLSATTAFVAAPKIAATSDGGAVLAWTQNSAVILRRVDGAGTPVGPPLEIAPATGSDSLADLHAAGNEVIVSFVHQTGGFGSPRHLLAQKTDAAGTLLWGPNHVTVFDGGSLQFGNFPSFVPDGQGGAVFAWYDAATFQLQSSVQRVLSDGSEAFAHDGVVVSTNTQRVRVNPSVSFDEATGDIVAYWVEQNAGQSQHGVYGQRIDAAGLRQWSDEGAVIVPLGNESIVAAPQMLNGAGTLVLWDAAPAFGTARIHGALVDAGGTVVGGPFDVSSTPASKSGLVLARSTAGFGALVWSDDRNDGGDIYAQNVNADGSLGPRWSELLGGTAGLAGVPVLSGSGPLTPASPLGVTLSSAPPGGLALLWLSLASTPAPFFGGTLYALPPALQLLIVTDGAGGFSLTTPFPAGVPAGTELVFQYLCQDLSSPYGKTLSNAQQGTTP